MNLKKTRSLLLDCRNKVYNDSTPPVMNYVISLRLRKQSKMRNDVKYVYVDM